MCTDFRTILLDSAAVNPSVDVHEHGYLQAFLQYSAPHAQIDLLFVKLAW